MRRSHALVLAAFCATLAACAAVVPPSSAPPQALAVHATVAGNVIRDPGFESGGFTFWKQCGSVPATLTPLSHTGQYAALLGSTKRPELNGVAAICQSVTIPPGGHLAFWIEPASRTGTQLRGYDQAAQLLGPNGKTLETLYKLTSSHRWELETFDVSNYAGRVVTLRFDVRGDGNKTGFVNQAVDDVALTASPVPTPTTSPTSAPASPTPSASPTPGTYACDDAQFVSYQSQFAAHTIVADQFVDVCGSVTSVLPSKVTSSGNHGYFYTAIAGSSPSSIEVVSNLDAMAQAPTGKPPARPWVAVNDYVYVQGRYYYDNASSQGIDWTEDDSGGSWPHTGYVAVCSSVGTGCLFYQ